MGTSSLSRGVKWSGHGINHPPPSRAEVKERVELYLYSPSVPSWHVIGWTCEWNSYKMLNRSCVKCVQVNCSPVVCMHLLALPCMYFSLFVMADSYRLQLCMKSYINLFSVLYIFVCCYLLHRMTSHFGFYLSFSASKESGYYSWSSD
jgi:hypothetical protein